MFMKLKQRRFILAVGMSLFLAACAPVVSDSLPQETGQDLNNPSGSGGVETEAEVDISEDPFVGVNLKFNLSFWTETDFTKHTVDYNEIFSGGPPPDGIPAIDSPVFEAIEQGDNWLGDDWPVMFFELNGDARAYPLAILIHHEIVNDVVGGVPVAITFCPLCNSTIAFDRTLEDGRILDFGTTGNLRNSDLVMYDRQTASWWQQFTGEGIVGELTSVQLEFLPSQIVAWSDFKENHPDGTVLSRQTGHFRPYGTNPYSGYDTINSNPYFPVTGDDNRLLPKERVVAIQIDGIDVAYPFTILSELKVVNDLVSNDPLVVFWSSGTESIFGNAGPDTGSSSAFIRIIDGQELTFVSEGDGFQDEQTHSLWNIFGEAVEGELKGKTMEQVISAEHFWFAWVTFKPETLVWSPPS